jgi:Uma2 family endonuclease
MVTREELMTVETFEGFLDRPENTDRHFELIHGEIVEKVPTELHGLIVFRLSGALFVYFSANPIGRCGVEVRYRVPGDAHNFRQPDLSVTLDLSTPPVTQGAVLRMPDLAVEVKSPNDTFTAMREKAAYYIANGTRLVWLIYPEKQLIEAARRDADLDFFTIDDTLTGDDLLPGFTLPVRTIFPG